MKIIIDNITINYEQEGEGKDVLLLHGWGASLQTMRPITDALKDKFKITAIDFPGFGKSSEPPDYFGVAEFTDITYKLIEKLGFDRPNIICHSFGGRVSILLAAGHPELIDKIVFTNSAGIRKKRTLAYYCKIYSYKIAKRVVKFKCIKSLLRLVGFDVEKHIKNAGSQDYKALSHAMKKIFIKVVNQDLKSYLKNIKSPSLLIWGENDKETPVCFGKIMEKEIPDAGLVVLNGAGHYSYLDDLPRYIKIVRTFFGG